MAEKGFGVKEINLIGASGTPTIESPNNLNLNAVNVAISTNVSIGGTLSVTGNVSVGGTLTYEDVTNIDSVGIITARSDVIVGRGLTVTGISTFYNDVDFGLYGNGGRKITFDESGDLLWFKKETTGGSSSKLGLGNGISYDHLQLQQTYTGGGQSEITAFNSNILISCNNTGKNITVQSQNDITLANGAYPFIKGEKNSSSDQSVTLYYGQTGSTPYANPKLVTTNTGVTVTGTVAATSFSGSGASLTGIAVTEAPVVDYTITGNNPNYYFHGGGVDETDGNPDLYLIRGQKYRFNNTTGSGHPFRFTSTGNANAGYSNGVTGDEEGVQFWTIPYDAPAKLFYVCTIHPGMVGNIYIRGANGQNDNVGVTTFSGQITASDHINLASTKKLSMAGDVFKIYHSTNGAIINESGDLIINNTVNNKRIKISTGSGPTESVRITQDGRMKVGFINNIDPTTVFDVMASAVNQDIVRFTGANYNRGLLISTAANGGTNDADIIYDAVSTNSKGKHTFKTDGTTRLHIDENGYLIKAAGRAAAFNVRGTNMSRTDTSGYICQFNDDTSTGCFDSGNNFNTSTYKFIAPVTGIYYFFTNIRLDQYNTGYIRTAFLSTNYGTGSSYYNYPETGHVISYPTNTSGIMQISTSTVVQLDKDDELYVWQNPSADNSYTVYLGESSFGGYLIG